MTAHGPRLTGEPVFVPDAPVPAALGVALLRSGILAAEDLVQALATKGRKTGNLPNVLRARNLVTDHDLLETSAQHWGLKPIDPLHPLPDTRLIDAVGAGECLRLGLVPWQRSGDTTIVAIARPEDCARLRPMLEAHLGPVSFGLAAAETIEAAVLARRGARLADQAENRVAAVESCRNWTLLHRSPVGVTVVALLGAALWAAPIAVGLVTLAVSLLSLFLLLLLKLVAAIAALRMAPPATPAPTSGSLPVVSIIVALFREGDIAPRLVRRLTRLNYPPELLDVILAVEAEDQLTRAALALAELPEWMRVVVVPAGQVKTKPRALNHALDYCRGSIVGVYDAEDAPEPDQIRKVVARFQSCGPDVACLQGVLDYYNPCTNWLSRCFTIEYATWFRLILPGIARLGLVVPLGGTTLFFRRRILCALGGWDAHNVTEDADLGIRLVRHGYRTELIATVTEEEANCRAYPWIKQRSRWIKGYMMTWAVHMRSPLLLWRQIGAWRFFGFQVMFLGSIAQTLLAPLLLSFMVIPFGFVHPLAEPLPPAVISAMVAIFVLSEALNLSLGILSLGRTSHRLNPLWVPTMKLYFPLASIAAYKALSELAVRPFYWDKTSHGIYDPPVEAEAES